MVRLSGLIAVLLIAGLPALVLPEVHLMGACVAAAAISLAALLFASLGLAICGAILALLIFSVALLITSSTDAIVEAALMGIAVLTLLDVAYYQQRFRNSAVEPDVAREHVSGLAVSVLISVLVAGVLALVAEVLSIDLDASTRPIIAASGGILVMVAILWAATTAVTRRS